MVPSRGAGRPPLPAASRALILQLAQENPRWGYQRLRGALLKLEHCRSATAIRARLQRYGVPPAPRRTGRFWRALLRAYAAGVPPWDCFTVERLQLQTLYVLFLIELQTRRVFVAGGTEHPGLAAHRRTRALEQVLREYVAHYDAARSHRALKLRTPLARGQPARPTSRITSPPPGQQVGDDPARLASASKVGVTPSIRRSAATSNRSNSSWRALWFGPSR